MKLPSTKPYLIRSIYEWCNECGYTPLLSVKAIPQVDFLADKIQNGEIIFNIHDSAVHNLVIGNDIISFSARFGGVAREVVFPTEAVKGIFAREVNQGIAFPENDAGSRSYIPEKSEIDDKNKLPKSGKPKSDKKSKASLRLVK
ncbi:MAG: ClpXP protease specificity-enhancing factor [Burkholderiales bacterium]|uniref:ClpXP protease specificity-enhancing factor n=1 Tax=Nitrosomonas sp. TaxID=42353 RepID=UPI0025F7BCAE|nr:ClpXP protease specificity-enhancing factor [Nitrosomonas sp.]MCP5246321.1 ClpXP protease specificity-enhancing factor [Burkholderiales bacterium]